jgi:hypothetical protein
MILESIQYYFWVFKTVIKKIQSQNFEQTELFIKL